MEKTLRNEIDKIKSNEWKDMFLQRLEGKTLNEIAKNYNLTRERVRQILDKIIDNINEVKEDKYKDIFEEYLWNQELFCQIFEEDKIVYDYLSLKYKIGYNDLKNLQNSNKLNFEQNKILQEYLAKTEKKISKNEWYIEFKAFLSQNSLTAKEVSELTGLSKPTIDSYMQGKRKPSDENKQILKEKLGFDILQSMYNIEQNEYEYCTYCGKQVLKQWKFCKYCGNKLD